jgi:hypothetical protein
MSQQKGCKNFISSSVNTILLFNIDNNRVLKKGGYCYHWLDLIFFSDDFLFLLIDSSREWRFSSLLSE